MRFFHHIFLSKSHPFPLEKKAFLIKLQIETSEKFFFALCHPES